MSFTVASDFGTIAVGGPSGQSFSVIGSAATATRTRAHHNERLSKIVFMAGILLVNASGFTVMDQTDSVQCSPFKDP